MEITLIYIISQIITIIYFAILSFSYLLKERKKILAANFIAHIGQTTAMAMLNGYTGAAMAFIMMLRDLTLLIQEKKKSNEKEINKKLDFFILIITVILIIVLTIFTYNGPLSLLSVLATLVTTFALWQKNVKIYKILGVIAGILWLAYNVVIMSIMGLILESILLICSTIGYIKDIKQEKRKWLHVRIRRKSKRIRASKN